MTKLTKSTFQLIADALRADAAHLQPGAHLDYSSMSAWQRGAYDQWNTTVMAIAEALGTTNQQFDRARFLAACGVQS